MTTVGPPDTDAQDPPARQGLVAGVRTSVRELGASIASVFRNPGLRRVELALAGSMIGDWAFATAVACGRTASVVSPRSACGPPYD